MLIGGAKTARKPASSSVPNYAFYNNNETHIDITFPVYVTLVRIQRTHNFAHAQLQNQLKLHINLKSGVG